MWVDLKVVHKIHDKGHTCKCEIRPNLNLKSLLIVVVAVFVVVLLGCFSLLFICRQAGDVKEILQDIERSLAWPFPAPCYRLVRTLELIYPPMNDSRSC